MHAKAFRIIRNNVPPKLARIMIITVVVLFCALICINAFMDERAAKLKIDESVLEYINNNDWSDIDFLTSKGFEYAEHKNAYIKVYDAINPDIDFGLVMIEVSTIPETKEGKVKKYKDIEYSSYSRIYNNDVTRVAHFYIERSNVAIDMYEVNHKGDPCAYPEFFKDTDPVVLETRVERAGPYTDTDLQNFIEKNSVSKKVEKAATENAAAEQATSLWISELGNEAEKFTSGQTIYVYHDTRRGYWIIIGSYTFDIFADDFDPQTSTRVPMSIVDFDGNVIAIGWK